ncbi:heavy metal transporter [Nautilia sp. PV-1]|uniref:heavy-metal-associated domain-containing protein n=1 Tax=Nautilia sp. PV-1 TaxID=2579250 RepID=UPI000FDC4A4B|nr:cation transporter [Nautilia sp. PV-1]AZV46985.1 heavy metal transporter [Nautilia sp. PV-1]
MRKLFIGLIFSTLLFAAQKVAIIHVEGMTCPLCTSAVKQSLRTTPGVIKARVILNTKTATVIFDDTKTNIKKLLHAIEVVGYKGKIIKVVK